MGYNSHPKIMKKLFYSFIMLVAMSLTFVACEQKEPELIEDEKPKVESNCELQFAQQVVQGDQSAYYFDITNGDLHLEDNQIAGTTGEYVSIMLFAQSQEDNKLPKEQKYDVISAEELTEYTICVVGGAIDQEGPFGTYGIAMTEGEVSDIFLCIDGNIKIEGDEKNATMTANFEFLSIMTEETFTREYIYNGAFDIEQYKNSAPQRVKIQK